MLHKAVLASCAFVVVVLSAPAQGALIDFELQEYPDVGSRFIDAVYDAGSDTFVADGFAMDYARESGGPLNPISSGGFHITANIDETGDAHGGTLEIIGNVIGFGPALLTAELLDFGFMDGGGSRIEFIFEVTAGPLSTDYGGVGAKVGVVMDVGVSYSGDFTQGFDNRFFGLPGTGQGISGTKPLALPGPGALAVAAIGGLIGSRRRRRRH
ncbi:MAG: hypothetical protein GY715_05305 [Planctomycetes bacterium]|nr:hypothetical protein [Planctomycetota bacterium]